MHARSRSLPGADPIVRRVHAPMTEPAHSLMIEEAVASLSRADRAIARGACTTAGGTVGWISREEASRMGRVTSAEGSPGAVPRILQISSSPAATARVGKREAGASPWKATREATRRRLSNRLDYALSVIPLLASTSLLLSSCSSLRTEYRRAIINRTKSDPAIGPSLEEDARVELSPRASS